MSEPWLKFYPNDWRSDPRLRMCSMAARGLWIEIIALMHEATPYGHLLVSGQSPTDAQLAVLAGAPPDQVPELLGELEAAGVFSRTRAGVIFSRKLTRMAKKAAIARNNGRKGGSPSLGKHGGSPPSDNPQVKGRVKPQKPEAREEKRPMLKHRASSRPTDPSGFINPSGSGHDVADFARSVFETGVRLLCRNGMAETTARALIGRWRKDNGDGAVRNAVAAAERAGVTDPKSYIAKLLKPDKPPAVDLDAAFAAAFASLKPEGNT